MTDVALAANALLTMEEAKAALDIRGDGDEVNLRRVINRASTMIEGWCERPLKEATYTALRVMGPRTGNRLWLAATPINVAQPLTVKLHEQAQTVWKAEADGDPAGFEIMVGSSDGMNALHGLNDHLYRHIGWRTAYLFNPYNVLLTYTGGYAVIPQDLQLAAVELAMKIWRDIKNKTLDVVTVTNPSGSVVMLDKLMSSRAMEILYEYRRRGV